MFISPYSSSNLHWEYNTVGSQHSETHFRHVGLIVQSALNFNGKIWTFPHGFTQSARCLTFLLKVKLGKFIPIRAAGG
jgi:hypothetical protein